MLNKLMGFFELRELGIPTAPWKIFNQSIVLDESLLWTVRTAVANGPDLNLPRAVGVTAQEATARGIEFLQRYGSKGMVIYYPYFIAYKSGTMEIQKDKIIIEGVTGDLWNLVTDGFKDFTYTYSYNQISECSQQIKVQYEGNKGKSENMGSCKILSNRELTMLIKHMDCVKRKYRNILAEGKSLLLEWSFAQDSDINRQPLGEKYLVFYELRTT